MIEMAAAASKSTAIGSLSPAKMIKPMGAELGNMIRVFESYFGPYPYDRLALTNIPASYGQGWPTLIYLSALSFLDSTQRNELGIKGSGAGIELTDFFRAHETSHQWWGHRVGWKSYHDQWLSEGFAQFSGNLYVQFRESEKAYLNRVKEDKEELLSKDDKGRVYETLGPVWMGARLASADSPRAYANVVYNKGGLIVHALRRMLWNSQSNSPDDRFIAMMKDYCRTYENKSASTEDFKAVLEKHMIPPMDVEGNGRMDWFFRQYVYGTGIPEYRMQWQADDAGGGQFKVRIKILQSGVPEPWMDILPVYAQSGGKIFRLGLLRIKGKESEFNLNLPYKPEKLLLNYMEDTLALIR
jgi:aminopeptidase N